MRKIAEFFKLWNGPILSGVLIGTSFAPFPPWALLFCYTPLFLWTARQTDFRKVFIGAWITQFILSLIGFHWIAHVTAEFSGFPYPVAILTLLAFSALIHLHVPLAAVAAHGLRRRFGLTDTRLFFALALVFSLGERVWPMIFPFHMAYGLLWGGLPVAQWADVIGFNGLSTVLLLLNAAVAVLWRARARRAFVLKGAAAIAVFLAAASVGGSLKQDIWRRNRDATLNVLAVQANIGNLDKVYAEQGRGFQTSIVRKFAELTGEGLRAHPGTDLVIWPETALPEAPDRPHTSRPYLDLITPAYPEGSAARLLTGAYSKEASNGGWITYNALFLLGQKGEVLATPYRKTELLAFGEYLPFSETFPVLLQWMPFISNFGRGPGPQAMTWVRDDGSALKLGGQICYEGLYPWFSRGLEEEGAEILFNVTNDSWFGTPAEPRQHMIMTLARAIETRRPLVRSTNTGISTAILASGDMLERSPSNKEWTGLFKIEYKKNPESTLYVRGGHRDWILWLIVLVLITAGGRSVGVARPGLGRSS